MTPETLTPSADIRDVAKAEVQALAREAATLGNLRQKVHERTEELLAPPEAGEQTPAAEAIAGETQTIRQEMADALREQEGDLAEATNGFEEVQLAELPGGVLGQVPKAGANASEAQVSNAIVTDPEELERTVRHEADAETGHASQEEPEAVRGNIALIVEGRKLSTTAVLEGDVERGTAQVMDGSPGAARPGQPEQDYAEGQRGANAVVDAVGEGVWKAHLKKGGEHAGDMAHLQGEIWKAQLQTRGDADAIIRVLDEAEETGYRKEAVEAIEATAA
ncbi:MAG: hypothetical protein PHW10_02975 [Candidatus Peribacteraceae bacterium]|nr:hypothetical protein [Candidatus Peribacteraceae bacterium]